jgi:hypothetical protein
MREMEGFVERDPDIFWARFMSNKSLNSNNHKTFSRMGSSGQNLK